MSGRLALVVIAALLFALTGEAKQSKQEPANSGQVSARVISMVGKVGAQGKTLAGDGENTAWIVSNPELLRDSIGMLVRIRARVDSRKHELQVLAVRIERLPHARLDDSAFRR